IEDDTDGSNLCKNKEKINGIKLIGQAQTLSSGASSIKLNPNFLHLVQTNVFWYG
ncbi:unnamed protein product, partial [marine sediment metagenome]